MKIVIASDSFKESLSSDKVNSIIADCLKELEPDIELVKVMIADGGEGTVDAIVNSREAEIKYNLVKDALGKKEIAVKWAVFNQGKDAIIEAASVVGLNLLPENERNPFYTTTIGIGELICHAADYGVENIYVGLGGTSTNDGGAGALSALGIKFLDDKANEIGHGGYCLKKLQKIDISGLKDSVKKIKFILLSDVENILCGDFGASHIFAPQKGASVMDAAVLDASLQNYQKIIKRDLQIDVSNLKGGGAAGGIGSGFNAFLHAEIRSGIKSILELIKFDEIIKDADLIITGEGKIDNQTKYGKAISGIINYAEKRNKPVIAFCALLGSEEEQIKKDTGLKKIYEIVTGNITKEISLGNPEKYLRICALKNLRSFLSQFSGV